MRFVYLLIVLGFPLLDLYATVRIARLTQVPVWVWLGLPLIAGCLLLRNERLAFRAHTSATMHGEYSLLRGLLDSGRKVLAAFLLMLPGILSDVMALLLLALPLSYGGALVWGLPGAALGSVTAVFVERAISLARISRLVGIPVSRLQDWATLAGLLVAAAISALAAGTVLGYVHLRPFLALAAGGLLLAIVYPAALYVTGQMRELTRFIASLRNAGAQSDISLPARPSTTAAK